MGRITSGVGLISGFPIGDVVDQLIALEARPLNLTNIRIQETQAQRTAFLDINARLLGLKSASSQLNDLSFFRSTAATSSDEDVLQATTTSGAATGVHTFFVDSLVTRNQLLSQGFASSDRTPVGAGSITIDSALARLERDTSLASLNNLQGIRGGTIRITDRSGASTEIDLTTVITLNDIIETINSQTAIDVQASVDGDRLVLTDLTGQTTANLTVLDIGNGRLAADFGIAGSVAANVLTGNDINNLTDDTLLSVLNDGNGVRREATDDFQVRLTDGTVLDINLSANLIPVNGDLSLLNSGNGVRLGTVRITDRTGASDEVDLSGATSIQEILDLLNAATVGINAIVIGDHLLISDTTDTPDPDPKDEDAIKPKLIIEDVSGFSALDLGIAGEVEDEEIIGGSIYRIDTIGDVIRVINLAEGNDGKLVASIAPDGNSLVLTDSTGAGLNVVALGESKSAQDLGLLDGTQSGNTYTGSDVIAGLNTVLLKSLNGGTGIGNGLVSVTARDGTVSALNITGVDNVQDLIDLINENTATTKISASLNATGNGIQIRDVSGGAGNLVITDIAGTAATDLKIAGSFTTDVIETGDLQKQYISENTRVDDLNNGEGIRRSKFRITAASGASGVIDLTQGNEQTLRDVINEINSRQIGIVNASTGQFEGIVASINASGDGILISDTSAGPVQLEVEDLDGGRVAEDLGIAGEAKEGQNFINGSFQTTIDIDADDSLEDVVTKINAADGGVRASIINVGGNFNPYRLSITSEFTGTNGELLLDAGVTGLSFTTLVEAKDAVIFLGSPKNGNAIPIVSSSNTLTDVVAGVTLNLVGTSTGPVTVSINKDVDAIESALGTFVQSYNGVIDRLNELTFFNPDTLERGLLLGDSTASRIRDRLTRMILDPIQGAGTFTRLSSVGIRFGGGGKLTFDSEDFRKAIEEDPQAVEDLFTTFETGAGYRIDRQLERLTTTAGGVVTNATQRLQNKEDLLSDRAESLQDRLDARRRQLEAEFQAMERVLAGLQQQQSALAGFTLIPPLGASNGGGGGFF